MSADNFIGVLKTNVGWVVSEGSMSIRNSYEERSFSEDFQFPYIGQIVAGPFATEEEAEEKAFRLESETAIVEYGVITLSLEPSLENVPPD